MKLSISNIAWTAERDEEIYSLMRENGFTGLEIAPTRIFPDRPYDRPDEAAAWSRGLYEEYGFRISSMQSIWYGRKENLFENEEERLSLLAYTRKAIDFAEAVGCGNLVFGCPRNRNIPDAMQMDKAEEIAVRFFEKLGEYAYEHGTVLSMEANPPIYNTNFINDTAAAIELVKKVDSRGFRLNLDIGTMLQNGESADELAGNVQLINHVHISEPGLAAIEARELHRDVIRLLENAGYDKFVSVEMGKQEDEISSVRDALHYVKLLT